MSCNKIQDKIEEYIEGCLSQQEKQYFDEHLACCDKCRQQVADMRATVDMLKDMEIKEVPRGLEARIVAAVQPLIPSTKRRGFSRSKVNAFIAAASALIIVTLAVASYPWFGLSQMPGTVQYKKTASSGLAHGDYLSTSHRFEVVLRPVQRSNGLRLLYLSIME